MDTFCDCFAKNSNTQPFEAISGEWRAQDNIEPNSLPEDSTEAIFLKIGGTSSSLQKETYDYVVIRDKAVPRSTLPDYLDVTLDELEKKNSTVIHHLESMLETSQFPSSWEIDNVNKPTTYCKKQSLKIAYMIFDKHNVIPLRIAPSVEEGILLTYFNKNKNRSLKIEIYNNKEVVGLINNNKTVSFCEELNSSKDFNHILKTYNG